MDRTFDPSLPDGLVSATIDTETSVETRDANVERAEARRLFLEKAKERWRTVSDVEESMRREMVEDFRFLQPGGQWDEQIRRDREADGRPCLEIDRLTGPVKQVCNQQRQLRPSIQINPVDSGSDPKTAEVLQGLIRHIEVSSDADVAYDTAGEHQTISGRGYWRVITEYLSARTNEQTLKIRRVRNPFSVYLDPAHEQPDGSDARYGFVVEDLTFDEFDARFGENQAKASLTEWEATGNKLDSAWYPENRIRIAEYFYVETDAVGLVEGDEGPVLVPLSIIPEGVSFRRLYQNRVKWALIDATDILEGNAERTAGRDWPGKYIPIIPVYGDESCIDGVVNYMGLVRRARDVQRMHNYWRSSITETIALAPRAPFVGVEGQFEGHEQRWKLANRRAFPYLEYRPVSFGGQMAPSPQRQVYEPPIQAMSMAMQQNEQDMRAVTGYVDVQAMERRAESSGRAILARQKQAELGNSNYIDNLGRAIRHTGRILLDLIPRIFDVPRVVRILGADQQLKTVAVAGMPPPPDMMMPEGVKEIYDLSVGTYDVTVSVGPSHETRRQEGVDSMLQLVQAVPAAAPAFLDLLVGNMDWPGALQISKRLQKLLPPPLQEAEEGQAPIPPQVQAQLAQASQMVEALTQTVNQLQQQIDAKTVEMQTRERIAQIQAQTQITIAQSQAASEQQVAMLEARLAQIETQVQLDIARLKTSSANETQAREHAHQQMQLMAKARLDAQQAARELAGDVALTHVDQVFEADQAEADREYEAEESEKDRESQQAIAKQQAARQAKAQASRT